MPAILLKPIHLAAILSLLIFTGQARAEEAEDKVLIEDEYGLQILKSFP